MYENNFEKKIHNDDMSQDKGEQHSTPFMLWRTFGQDTTLHGLNKISTSSKIRSCFWCILILGSTAALLYNLVNEIDHYNQYPHLTSLSVHAVNTIYFPAITICNMSPTNRSKVIKDPRDDNYGLSISSSMSFLADDIDWNDTYYKDNGYFEPRSLQNEADESLDISSFIMESTFDNEHVSLRHFTQKVTRFGMCYTWNKDRNTTTESNGALNNFYVVLNINEDLNYLGLETATGIKVVVHDHEEEPDIENKGFTVPPGHLAFAAISKTEYELLPSPFKAFENENCVDTGDTNFINPIAPDPYNVMGCTLLCASQKIYEECGCVSVASVGDFPYCSKYQYKTCFLPVAAKITAETIQKCQCPKPCSQTEYKVDLSYVIYPSDYGAEKWVNITAGRTSFTKEYLQNNIIQLRVYFEDLKYTKVEQVPVYPSFGVVLSNIGGYMGLFIGASLLTVTEIAEFLIFIGIYFVKKFFDNNRVSTEHKNNNSRK